MVIIENLTRREQLTFRFSNLYHRYLQVINFSVWSDVLTVKVLPKRKHRSHSKLCDLITLKRNNQIVATDGQNSYVSLYFKPTNFV